MVHLYLRLLKINNELDITHRLEQAQHQDGGYCRCQPRDHSGRIRAQDAASLLNKTLGSMLSCRFAEEKLEHLSVQPAEVQHQFRRVGRW
ncbi:hypothetical protein PHYPO_G00191570 [Pangasianodon hypophthalmus]|uniref:Uncharacterized protein n=1 Tax=Pangasianodon hypophthalmus TaxID=310915 RepID=A0A5N5PHU0_PANHP|nr:hypothetical protein PHYPO_G00191570 [Pangasianodon hypophthalmus]